MNEITKALAGLAWNFKPMKRAIVNHHATEFVELAQNSGLITQPVIVHPNPLRTESVHLDYGKKAELPQPSKTQTHELVKHTNMGKGYVDATQFSASVDYIASQVEDGFNASINKSIDKLHELVPVVVKTALMLGVASREGDGSLSMSVPEESHDMPAFLALADWIIQDGKSLYKSRDDAHSLNPCNYILYQDAYNGYHFSKTTFHIVGEADGRFVDVTFEFDSDEDSEGKPYTSYHLKDIIVDVYNSKTVYTLPRGADYNSIFMTKDVVYGYEKRGMIQDDVHTNRYQMEYTFFSDYTKYAKKRRKAENKKQYKDTHLGRLKVSRVKYQINKPTPERPLNARLRVSKIKYHMSPPKKAEKPEVRRDQHGTFLLHKSDGVVGFPNVHNWKHCDDVTWQRKIFEEITADVKRSQRGKPANLILDEGYQQLYRERQKRRVKIVKDARHMHKIPKMDELKFDWLNNNMCMENIYRDQPHLASAVKLKYPTKKLRTPCEMFGFITAHLIFLPFEEVISLQGDTVDRSNHAIQLINWELDEIDGDTRWHFIGTTMGGDKVTLDDLPYEELQQLIPFIGRALAQLLVLGVPVTVGGTPLTLNNFEGRMSPTLDILRPDGTLVMHDNDTRVGKPHPVIEDYFKNYASRSHLNTEEGGTV